MLFYEFVELVYEFHQILILNSSEELFDLKTESFNGQLCLCCCKNQMIFHHVACDWMLFLCCYDLQ